MPGILSNLFNKDWTIMDLMNVDPGRQQKSSGCSVNLENTYVEVEIEGILDKFKRFFTRNKSVMNTFYVIFKFNVISDTGHSYPVLIRTMYDPDGNLYTRNIAQVYCECADFKFSSAWTLNQHNSLFNSDRTVLELGPAISNAPKRRTKNVLCKHSYAALMYLINNYGGLMRNV